MPSINISEDDFNAVSFAANDAADLELANQLDKIARKMNAALSNASTRGYPFRSASASMSWKDVPSCLISNNNEGQ